MEEVTTGHWRCLCAYLVHYSNTAIRIVHVFWIVLQDWFSRRSCDEMWTELTHNLLFTTIRIGFLHTNEITNSNGFSDLFVIPISLVTSRLRVTVAVQRSGSCVRFMPQTPTMHHHHGIPLLAAIRDVAIVLSPWPDVGVELGAVVSAAYQGSTAVPVVVAVAITQTTNAVIAVGVR